MKDGFRVGGKVIGDTSCLNLSTKDTDDIVVSVSFDTFRKY